MSQATQDTINTEVFARLNKVESKVDETNGYLRGVVESNRQIIDINNKMLSTLEKRDTTMWRVICILAGITTLSLAAVIYGAIGKEGLHAVRQTTIPPVGANNIAIPAHNDFDKWMYAHPMGQTTTA